MEFFSKDELLQAAASGQRPCESVVITLGAVTKAVWVQGMSGAERDAWEQSLVRQRNGQVVVKADNVRARLAVRCLVTEPGGARIFSDADAEMVGQLPAAVLQPIYEKAQRLSTVSKDDIDELERDSEPAAGSDSRTNSL